jgi:hypothetical protein
LVRSRQFQGALLSAFNRESLTQMARQEMNVNLDIVAGGSNLGAIVFNLIDWAQRTGRLGELIAATARSNGGNPEVIAFMTSLGSPPASRGNKRDRR